MKASELRGLYLMGMALACTTGSFAGSRYDPTADPKPKPRYIPEIIPPGCKKFVIDGIEVIALNEKNAIRKAAKLKANG